MLPRESMKERIQLSKKRVTGVKQEKPKIIPRMQNKKHTRAAQEKEIELRKIQEDSKKYSKPIYYYGQQIKTTDDIL